MKYTTVKISEIRKHPTKRMDAGYWIRKKGEWQKDGKKLKKLQATSLTQLKGIRNYERN